MHVKEPLPPGDNPIAVNKTIIIIIILDKFNATKVRTKI
jgi:hypothetical protein